MEIVVANNLDSASFSYDVSQVTGAHLVML